MEEVVKEILKEKIIVIVRGVDRPRLLKFAEALYRGGIRLMEVTYTEDKPETDKDTAETIRALAEQMGGRMQVGAGTVTRREQVDLTRAAGGTFIISPDTNPDVIAYTKKQGLVSIPGALTPTEIALAHRSGADFVKLFPVSAFGAAYVKAVKAPLSGVRLLAVGGVCAENLLSYAAAGVSGFGIGFTSGIATKEEIERCDSDAVTEKARELVTLAKGG